MKGVAEIRAELEELAASNPIAIHHEADPIVRECIASAIRALEAAERAERLRIDPTAEQAECLRIDPTA
jgi:hypothetical protein